MFVLSLKFFLHLKNHYKKYFSFSCFGNKSTRKCFQLFPASYKKNRTLELYGVIGIPSWWKMASALGSCTCIFGRKTAEFWPFNLTIPQPIQSFKSTSWGKPTSRNNYQRAYGPNPKICLSKKLLTVYRTPLGPPSNVEAISLKSLKFLQLLVLSKESSCPQLAWKPEKLSFMFIGFIGLALSATQVSQAAHSTSNTTLRGLGCCHADKSWTRLHACKMPLHGLGNGSKTFQTPSSHS